MALASIARFMPSSTGLICDTFQDVGMKCHQGELCKSINREIRIPTIEKFRLVMRRRVHASTKKSITIITSFLRRHHSQPDFPLERRIPGSHMLLGLLYIASLSVPIDRIPCLCDAFLLLS